MAHESLDRDGDGLLCLVGDDQPDALLASVTLGIGLYLTLALIQGRPLGRAGCKPSIHGLALNEILRRLVARRLLGPRPFGPGPFGRAVVLLFLRHYPFSRCFWFKTVRSRAMFFRTSLSCPVFSNCPVACWKRRLKSSRLVAARRSSSSSTSSSRASIAFTTAHPLAPQSGSLSGASGRRASWPRGPDRK